MKKSIIIIAIWSLFSGLNAQTMKQIFQTLPDTILPSLTKNDRLDLIDLIENNMQNEVTNQLKGKSRMTLLTPNLTKIRLSELVEVQLCKLPTPTSYFICYIHSVKTDTWDSTIRFYNPDWTLVANQQTLFTNAQPSPDFQHLDFNDDTTLTLTSSHFKSESGQLSLKSKGSTTVHWDSTQSRFVR
jgi:hypothetical protein